MPSKTVVVWSMSRAAEKTFTMEVYSVLALLLGTSVPPPDHRLLFIISVGSPRSVSATMLRVSEVTPEVLVTHISTRLILIPEVLLGRVFIHESYLLRK